MALIIEVDNQGGSNPIFVGMAVPSSATSASVWQIRKLTYDVNGNVASVLYADGSDKFHAIWDNRAGLSYS